MNGELHIAQQCASGNRLAQRQLFEQHIGMLMGVCRRYIINASDAEDVIQEAFVKIFQNIHTYRGDCALGGWMRRIVTNMAIDWIRKYNKLKFNVEINDQLIQTPQSDAHLENSLYEFSAADAMKALEKLPERFRVCLNLFAIDGYTHQQIAEMLNITESTSRSNVTKARKLLIEILDKKKVVNHATL